MVAANEYTGSVKRSFVEYAIWRVRKGILYAIAAAQSGNEEPFEVAVYKLTEREREVIHSFNEGKSAAEIAESMKIPESLVTLLYRRGNRKLDHQKKK
jgi:DNA-binding NarL/FixJ family response regulator